MILATPYWSLWIRVPAYVVGVIIFLWLCQYGFDLLKDGKRETGAKRSNWMGYLLIAFGLLGVQAYFAAWGEKRVVAAFAEWLVVLTVCYGVGVGGAAAGFFVGYKVYKKTSQQWLGWVIGILIALAVGGSVLEFCSKIPGIGWRIEQILEEQEEADDY